jgi:uncharacterized RDD family membrane protein YckC
VSDSEAIQQAPPPAGLLRRLGAMLYDTLIVIALLMVITAALLPLTGGEAITSERYGALEYVYQVALLGIVIVFFGWFWTHRGQTLGMQAWRLKVVRQDASTLTWLDAVKRLAAAIISLAPLGLGYFWLLIDRDKLTWHDRLTRTRVVVLPKK